MFRKSDQRTRKPVKPSTVWWAMALTLFVLGVVVIVIRDLVTTYAPAATEYHNILVVLGVVLIFASGLALYVSELCASVTEK